VRSPSYEPARCVVCGHTDSETIAEHDDLRAEIEALWEYHQRRLRPDTPPQHLTDRVAFSEHPPFRLVRCRECGLVYRNPVERVRELAEIYQDTAPPLDVLRSLHATQLPAVRVRARVLRRLLGRGGSGLEIGSHVGAFLVAAREEGLHFEGLDINAEVNAFTRAMGFAVHDGEVTSFDTDRTFDVVAIWNTFDQLADPRAAVNAAARLLRPGGIFVVRVPNGEFYVALRSRFARGGRVERAVARALLAQNNLLGFPYRYGFTRRAVTRLFEEHGFEPCRVHGDVLVPIGDEWTRPWARIEEILIKRLLAVGARHDAARWAPWLDVFAVRDDERFAPPPPIAGHSANQGTAGSGSRPQPRSLRHRTPD
jgi:SAM-dependent methyltransferase